VTDNAWPHLLEKLQLRDRSVTAFEENEQDLQGLRLDVDRLAVLEQPEGCGIHHELVEFEGHHLQSTPRAAGGKSSRRNIIESRPNITSPSRF
jgi:hypothetical protein